MISQILTMFGLTVLQNASFTLVSRARNSKSLAFHTIASILSNGIYLLVIRHVVTNLNNWVLMVTYVVGAVVGGLIMHHISMNYLEKVKDWKDLFKRSPNRLVGKNVKGFEFKTAGNLGFVMSMTKYVDQLGKIERYNPHSNSYRIRFADGEHWNYPASEINKHLV